MKTMKLNSGRFGEYLSSHSPVYQQIYVDRTYYGTEWCRSHGYNITGRVQDESGCQYDIWEQPGYYRAAVQVR